MHITAFHFVVQVNVIDKGRVFPASLVVTRSIVLWCDTVTQLIAAHPFPLDCFRSLRDGVRRIFVLKMAKTITSSTVVDSH